MKPSCYVSEHKELEQRVRDLEAELAEQKEFYYARTEKWEQEKARAEKAEMELAELKKRMAEYREIAPVIYGMMEDSE